MTRLIETLDPPLPWKRIAIVVAFMVALVVGLAVMLPGCGGPRPTSADGSTIALMWLSLVVGFGFLLVLKRRRQFTKPPSGPTENAP